ncbi:pentatricopeptide repeat-containing At4g02820, mitochondrial [Olea europaea subsp. europaea]|uniref:Pentatricopeptide repeat-containing At4g02820, mitochondrial n=1 Tax=Olea europaea subsp. europaea TaxID=158383 RepID=A0A8S0P9X4_OLEEU|nr:pentatricopeptide repeat-containing At4g02820, mitochondrial [Olea europaea subsp. europaea]
MLSRLVRTSIAAATQLSTKTAALATVAEPLTDEGNTVSSTSTNRTTAGGRDTLGRRLLALVYMKRSAVVTIRKWKEEGHVVRKYELNRIIRELRKLKRYKHALEICEWMRIQDDIKLVPGDYAVHLDLIAKLRGINSAEKFFEDLPDKMRDQAPCSALLHTYAQHKETAKAEALMEKMSECGFLKNSLPYNHMISLYISTGQLEKVPDMIKELKKNGSPDVITYNLWLTVCASQNYIETAEKVFLELKKAKVDPDWVTYSTLTSLYIKNSLKEKAEFALREMEKKVSRKVRVAYASLISLHTSLENKNDIHRIWKKMKSTFRKLNDVEYTCMITSLLKLERIEEAEKLYKEWESVSPTKDSRVPNLLIATYISKNEMEKAEAFHDQMVKKSMVSGYTTWELLTWCYLKKGQMGKVLDCFKKAVGCVKKWNPDEKMLQEVFRIVEEHGSVEGAEQLIITLRSAGHVKTEAYNSLLRTYAKAGKMPLIVAERMKMDNVKLNEETQRLLELTSKMSVGELPHTLS